MERISFIIYYDDERSLGECVYYLKRLHVPKGYEVDYVSVKDAENMGMLRECAERESDAAYKIYIDQNMLVTNTFLLYEILVRFQENRAVDEIGLWGTEIEEGGNLGRMLLWGDDGISDVNCMRGRADEQAESLSEIFVATRCDSGEFGDVKLIPCQDYSWCIYDCRSDKGEGLEREYRYFLLRAEVFRDKESRELVGRLIESNRLTLQQQIQRAENQAFAKTTMGYYWEDYYFGDKKWKKYLDANGRIALHRNDNEVMNVVMAFNHGYVKYARVMLRSLYENNGLVNICVHVLQCDLDADDKVLLKAQARRFGQKIVFYEFDKGVLPEEIITTQEWSVEAYFRLFMVDILPVEVNRILYLDVDVIVNKPLYDFYYMDMQGYEIVGCRDFSLILQEGFADKRKELFASVWDDERFVYINSGVMLVDVALLREKREDLDYMRILCEKKEQLLAPDQDIINLVHWENVGLVDEYRYDFFNACFKGITPEEVKQYVSIIHYAGPKPWMPIDIEQHAHRIWWEYSGE